MANQTRDGLELQISEIEMLQSMYANPGEFVLDDPTSVEQVQAFLAGDDFQFENLNTRIGFTINISVKNEDKSLKIELVCQLPHEYPFVKPQFFTRAPHICRERHKILREDLNRELDEQSEGEICVGILVEWLRERLHEEIEHIESQPSNSVLKPIRQEGRDTLTRLWIYSHHIYSKIKRRDIQDWGQELNLHGFSMPGKPGVICAEGATCDVDEFWYRIRRMNWKKICIKEQEVVPFPKMSESNKSSIFKFSPFSELVFDARGGKGREYHMDLGQFSTFLQEHDSSHVFSLFFGVSGKPADD